jgi:hypothetical protein
VVKASTEMAYNGVEMPPDAFLVLEGPAVSSAAVAAPGLPPMMQAMMQVSVSTGVLPACTCC